jgi:hypothetical protein
MLITNNRLIMGEQVNGRAINILGWITVAAIFAANIGVKDEPAWIAAEFAQRGGAVWQINTWLRT